MDAGATSSSSTGLVPSDSSVTNSDDPGSTSTQTPPPFVDPVLDSTPTPETVETTVQVVVLDQGQMDVVAAGILVTVFLLAAILFAQLRRP